MVQVILTLKLPRGGRGIPVATTANLDVFRYFKDAVLREWGTKAEVDDEDKAMLARLVFEQLRKALDTFIPDILEAEASA